MNRRLEALQAMAAQDVSPHERDIAQAKLEAMGAWPPPPRPPAPSAAAAPQPDWSGMRFNWTTTAGAAGNAAAGNVFIDVNGTAMYVNVRVTS